MPRKRENKNYHFVPSLPDAKFNIAKKFKKLKNACMASFKHRLEKAEKERKQKLSVCFVPPQRVIEHSKKIAKKLKHTIMAPFEATIG